MISLAGISAVAVLAAGHPPPAPSPAGLPVRVAWDAPAGCSDAESFYTAVLARAERARRAQPGEDGARLEVKLARLGPRVHGELRMVTEDGKSDLRKVDGATCDEVAEALSLTAALALTASVRPSSIPTGQSPTAPSSTPSPSPSSSSSPSSSPSPPRPTQSPVLPPAAPRPPPSAVPARSAPPPPAAAPGPARPLAAWFTVGLGPQAGEVVAPHLGLGGTAYLRFEAPGHDRLAPSATLGFLYLRNDLLGGADAVFRLSAATLTACPGLGWRGRFAVELCALGVGGALSASDTGVNVGRPVTRSWWSAGAELRIRAPVGRGFSVQLDASASLPLVKRRFVTTTPEQTVGTSPSVATVCGVSVTHGL